MLAAKIGTEAEICTRPAVKRRFEPNAALESLYAPRLKRFRALYASERQTRLS
jgi:xylulokinase